MDYFLEPSYQIPETYYLSTPLTSPNYPLDFAWYSIIKRKKCPFGNDFFYVIVRAQTSVKVNVYGTFNDFNAYNLVRYYEPLKLIDAQFLFPEENFTEETYGFEKLFIPPGVDF